MIAKKRLLPILMAVLMVFAMMPMSAGTVFAEADPDTQAPVINLDSFTLSLPDGKDKATVGDTITATAEVTDDRYVKYVNINLHSPVTGTSRRINLEYTGTDETRSGIWTGTYTITDEDENGIWKIEHISTHDGQNDAVYSNNNVYSWGNADLSAYDFEVYGTSSDPDVTPPVITLDNFTLSLPDGKDKATVGDTITATAEVTDDRYVKYVNINLHSPVTGTSRRINLEYTGTDETRSGIWTGTYTITDEDENGIWKIEHISTHDGQNDAVYSNNNVYSWGNADLSAYDFEVVAPECPADLTTSGYSMMLDGAGATSTFGGNYYVNTADETVTPTVKVRFDAEDGTWTTLSLRKYTLKYEKKTGENSWVEYSADTFGVDDNGTATYRVSAIGKESLYYTGTVGPVEFKVIQKKKVTFNSNGGSSIDPQYVIPGEKASKPADPTREGWHFGGEWYTDPELTTTFNFNNPVTEDVTLYASWYAYMAIGVYNQSNPQNYQCGTVDIAIASSEYRDVTTMNFTAPEGEVWFAAKPAAGYKFKGFFKGIVGSSHYVETPSDELLTDNTEYLCNAGEAAICAVFECTDHQWEQKIQKATPDKEGRIYQVCSICGAENTEDGIIPLPQVSNISLAGTSYTYTGKAIKPKVTVANAGEELSTDVYDVTYSNNTNVGTATVKVTLKGDYYEGTKSLTFKINKAANPLTIKPKTATVKYSKLKKKTQTLAVTKVIKFTKLLKDKKTYTLSSAKKGKKSFKKYFKVNKTTGKVTVKKGLKKGTYNVKVKVKAAGNANYKESAVKMVTFKVRVK